MTDVDKGYLLVGLDGSELNDAIVQHAIWVSQCNQHPLQFLHVIEHPHNNANAHHEGNLTPDIRDHLLQELSEEEHVRNKEQLHKGKQLLAAARTQAEQAGLQNVTVSKRHGTLPDALAVLEPQTDLVILGCKGESHRGDEKGLGLQLEASIKAVHTPVFVIKKAFTTPKKLMFAYNGSENSKKALEMVKNYRFCSENLEIHVVCVHKEQAAAEALLEDAAQNFQQAGITISVQALHGDPVEVLIQYQKEHQIDITAMGAFSHGKVHHFFFGSFTTQMLLKSDTHFLIVR